LSVVFILLLTQQNRIDRLRILFNSCRFGWLHGIRHFFCRRSILGSNFFCFFRSILLFFLRGILLFFLRGILLFFLRSILLFFFGCILGCVFRCFLLFSSSRRWRGCSWRRLRSSVRGFFDCSLNSCLTFLQR